MRALRHLPTLLALALVAAPVAAAANAFDEFRIPDNRALLWTGTVNGRGDRSDGSIPYERDRSGLLQGGLSSRLWWRSDAEEHSTTIGASVRLDGDRIHRDKRVDDWPSNYALASTSGTRDLAQFVSAGIEHRSYVAGGPWYGSGWLSATGNYSQNSGTFRSTQTTAGPIVSDVRTRDSAWNYDNQVALMLGAGAGRVRNATGVYEARVLERRLRESGALVRPLGEAARTRLASLMYARRNLDVVHDRPAAGLWGAIERILRDDGAVRDSGVTAEEWFRTVEPYFTRSYGADPDNAPSSPVVRLRGCTATAVVRLQTRHELQRHRSELSFETVNAGVPGPSSHSTSYTRSHDSSDLALAGGQAEGHWPVSEAVQLDAYVFALGDVQPGDEGFQLNSNANATWMLAERWLIVARLAQARSFEDPGHGGHTTAGWSVLAGGNATYFVTDHVDAALSCSASRGRNEVEAGAFNNWNAWTGAEFGFSLTYRFAGFASIPSLSPFLAD